MTNLRSQCVKEMSICEQTTGFIGRSFESVKFQTGGGCHLLFLSKCETVLEKSLLAKRHNHDDISCESYKNTKHNQPLCQCRSL